MSINELEQVTESILLSFGIERVEFDGLMLLIMVMTFVQVLGVIAYFKIRCSGVSCKGFEKIHENSGKVAEKLFSLEETVKEMKIVDSSQHLGLKDDLVKIDSLVIDLRSSVSQLHGIILGGTIPPGRRRIENDSSE